MKQEKHKQHSNAYPDLTRLRPGLFWDTDINKIDWPRQREAVIKRIFERGNEEEKTEIARFYGDSMIQENSKK